MAVKNDDTPYTSPSTAENQNESENVYAKAPTNPAPITENNWPFESTLPKIFLPKAVIVQNRNRIVKALQVADNKFIIYATLVTSPKAKFEKKFPRRR